MKTLPWIYENATQRYNDAIVAGHLFSTGCARNERCALCGLSLHPYRSRKNGCNTRCQCVV
jgi:hypothetical protein